MKRILSAIFLVALVFIIVSYISTITSKPNKIINQPKQTNENVEVSVLELLLHKAVPVARLQTGF